MVVSLISKPHLVYFFQIPEIRKISRQSLISELKGGFLPIADLEYVSNLIQRQTPSVKEPKGTAGFIASSIRSRGNTSNWKIFSSQTITVVGVSQYEEIGLNTLNKWVFQGCMFLSQTVGGGEGIKWKQRGLFFC